MDLIINNDIFKPRFGLFQTSDMKTVPSRESTWKLLETAGWRIPRQTAIWAVSEIGAFHVGFPKNDLETTWNGVLAYSAENGGYSGPRFKGFDRRVQLIVKLQEMSTH
jgi:hypothetical protein